MRRLRSWFRNREEDLDRELKAHLDLEAEERQNDGLTPEDARYAARRVFGNTTAIREDVRAVWGWASLERVGRDLRYGARTLVKAPAFSITAIVSLSLGIGANAAIFALLNALVLRTLPVADPDQLVQLSFTGPDGADNWSFSYPQLEDFRNEGSQSEIFGSTSAGRASIRFRGQSDLARGDAVTDNFFAVLGVSPQLGRLLAPGDDRTDASAAVLGDRYWRERLSSDPSVLGQTITINEAAFTVVGVAPRRFSGVTLDGAPDFWVPLHAMDRLDPDANRWRAPLRGWLQAAARVRRDATRERAQAELDTIYRRRLLESLPKMGPGIQEYLRDSRLVLRPAENGLFSDLRTLYALPLKLLLALAGAALLIACANLANLLLARGAHRGRELAVRLALGAGRGRLVRQLLTECALLALVGGVVGLAIAWWGGAILVGMISTGHSTLPLDVRPDWRVVGFTFCVSLLTAALFGSIPAFRGARLDPARALTAGVRHTTRLGALNRALLAGQVAASVTLAIVAGLFVRTLHNLWSVDMGYDRENILTFSVNARLAGYETQKAASLYREILRALEALPDVRSAAVSTARPVDDQESRLRPGAVDDIDGRELFGSDEIGGAWDLISPGYFSTLGSPLLLGRDFRAGDDRNAAKVVIVNESLARRAFPDQNPIGRHIDDATVVGVVQDARYVSAHEPLQPMWYRPLFQSDLGSDVSFLVRYRDGARIADAVRREVAAVDRNLPVFRVQTLREQTHGSFLRERLLASLSATFGALAVVLASIGLYGLTAYTAARRTNEIGIRAALGASRADITWLVVRETLWLALAGTAAGVPLALWTAQAARSLLFGVGAVDPPTIAAAVVALMGVALIAGFVPARRACRISPMTALRTD